MSAEPHGDPSRQRADHVALPPDLPRCPPGWITAPPDYVGVGAQRCGTTWWHRQILRHPGVVRVQGNRHKELHFFDSLAGVDVLSPEQVERYARHFPRPQSGAITGEWTPRYMFDPWAVPQLAQAAPKARILVLLRDPLERAASGFEWASRLERRRGEAGLGLDTAIEQQRLRGLYADQVQRVLDAFAREQILILQYERCRSHYEEELERTYAFLGLDTAFRPAGERHGPRSPTDRELPGDELARLIPEYVADVRRLVELAPEIDVSLWPSVRDLV